MKQRSILAAMAVFALAILSFTSSAFAQANTEVVTFPVDGIFANPCCDELSHFTGNVRVVFRTTVNSDGTITVSSSANLSNFKGTGLSTGISYHANEHSTTSETFTLENAYPYSFQQTFTSNTVGKGKGGRECSFKIKGTVHFVVDENGDIVIDHVDIEFICANGNTIE